MDAMTGEKMAVLKKNRLRRRAADCLSVEIWCLGLWKLRLEHSSGLNTTCAVTVAIGPQGKAEGKHRP